MVWLRDFASPRVAWAIIVRSQRINERAIASGIRALRPIHATAIANRRRVKI